MRATHYWEFLDRPIRYREDAQYEEHFRDLFAQSYVAGCDPIGQFWRS